MEDHAIPHLREALVFLALAGLMIPLLQRFRINSVMAFLVVGMLVGPFGFGRFEPDLPVLGWLTFANSPGVAALAEIGVVFLMFSIGLELSIDRLWSMRRWVFGAGSLQVVLTAAVIGAIAWQAGHALQVALIIGLTLAFSSTAVVMQLLAQRRELASPTGRSAFSILLLQDLAVVPVLILVGLFGTSQSSAVGIPVLIAMGKALLAVGVIYFLGNRVIRPVFRSLGASRQADTFMALTLLSTLGIAAATAAAGLSLALGALLAGLLLAETEFRHEVEIAIEPFRGLLMGLFFLSVGMGIDPMALARQPVWLPLSLIALFFIKGIIVFAVLRTFGLSRGRAAETGLLLGQGGEFAFIVIGSATALEVLPAATGAFLMLLVGLSLFATPIVADLGERLGRLLDRGSISSASGVPVDIGEHQGHVVIAGYGRVGQLVASLLDSQGISWIAIDDRPAAVARFHQSGLPVYVGDASRAEMLGRLGLDSARALVLTMDNPGAAANALRAARSGWPELPVLVRARDESDASDLRQAGAAEVIPEALESALQLGARVLGVSGLPDELAAQIVAVERNRRTALWSNPPAG